MEDKVQQTIVIRTLYPDNNGGTKKIRAGKHCSQAAHSSIAFLTNKFKNSTTEKIVKIDSNGNYNETIIKIPAQLTKEEEIWINDSFTKICLYVETEEELLEVYENAKNAGLTVELITDSGKTEFSVPTKTCLAIGPHYKSKIDPITQNLKLY